MREWLTLGPVPVEEDCVQVNSNGDYLLEMSKEVRRFVELLNNRFVNQPEGAYFAVKSEYHDFGQYKEAAVFYDSDDAEAEEFAFFVECNLPMTWNETKQVDWKEARKSEVLA
jgi:hypothetical protein